MIDANGTRYHLLLGYEDWSQCTDDLGNPIRGQAVASPSASAESDLFWDDQKKEVTLRPELFIFTSPSGTGKHSLSERRGAARDRYGSWYWISPNSDEILVNSAGSKRTSHFWSIGDGELCDDRPDGGFQALPPNKPKPSASFRGLAVTESHYLIVGMTDTPSLLVFDLFGGGSPQKLLWPFVPFEITPAPGGGVWILDSAGKRYWGLDKFFNVIRDDSGPQSTAAGEVEDFRPVGGGNVHRGPVQPSLPEGFSIAAKEPIGIQGLPDGTVLILDRNPEGTFPLVYWYRHGSQKGTPVSTACILEVLTPEQARDFHLDAYDFVFLPKYDGADNSGADRMFIVTAEGKQAFAFHLTHQGDQLEIEVLDEYLPMRLFGGKALVAGGNGVYYDFDDRWIPLLSQLRPRYAGKALLQTSGERPFDGREPDCVWHRLCLDACLPSGTMVWSRAANSVKDLHGENWTVEPRPYLRGRGSELPFVERTTGPGRGTWELLLQNAVGRYLQLKLELSGNGRSTPHLRALRVYYPRFSYLDHYLPSVYRDDVQSGSFLERFLANLEGFYTELEGRIAAVQMLFDPQSSPGEALAWLASWFGVALDPAWSDARRRLFLRNAMIFFQYRGTIRGLRMALSLALSPESCTDAEIFNDDGPSAQHGIRIIEKFRSRRTPGIVFGDPTDWAVVGAVPAGGRWTPEQGGALLHQRYVQDLGLPLGTQYPVRKPADGQTAVRWTAFSQRTLGFIPSATDADAPSWQAFLTHRYLRYSELDPAYRSGSASFQDIPVPGDLPADKGPLLDWFQFESVVLATQKAAHRFSVLLPLPKSSRSDAAEQLRRRELTERVVNLEKPAHTVFDLKFYWALFRVGEARLGEDTVLDLGGRSPALMSPMVLGQGHLVENYLAGSAPDHESSRLALGDGGCSTCPA